MRRRLRLLGALAVVVMVAACEARSSEADGSPSQRTDSGPPRACNGHSELCDRPLDQVVFPATHNAMSNADEGWMVPNQQHGLLRQLEDGVRGMLLDTHAWEGGVYLCHGFCELGARPLGLALAEIRGWMDEHPSEILVLVLEDGISAEETAGAFDESGLAAYTHAHPDGAPWPTLGALIDAGERLLVSAEQAGPPPAWYHHAWDLMRDTRYSFDSVEAFTCEHLRGDFANDLFLLNHWVGNPLPAPENADAANPFEVLHGRAKECAAAFGALPNLVAVDFYERGDLFAVVDALNEVSAQ